jgi:drug/metabolite transporter (DMT)-like permease
MILFPLLATLLFGINNLVWKKLITIYSVVDAIFYRSIFTFIICLSLVWVFNVSLQFNLIDLRYIYLSCTVSALALFLWVKAIGNLPIWMVLATTYFNSVFSLLLGYIVFGEHPNLVQAFGCILILAGFGISNIYSSSNITTQGGLKLLQPLTAIFIWNLNMSNLKQYTQIYPPISIALIQEVSTFIIAMLVFIFTHINKRKTDLKHTNNRLHWLFIAASILAIAVVTEMKALATAPLFVNAVFSTLTSIIGMIAGVVIWKEKMNKFQVLGVLLMCFGVLVFTY